jgi:GTP pyrophosphokinase
MAVIDPSSSSVVRIDDVLARVRAYNPDADLELLKRAYVFTAMEHQGQVRRSGEPYLTHPLAVAGILADMRMDVVCIATGLLHDVVEDTGASTRTIREYFGDEIADLVEGVTKLAKIRFSSRAERQAESFRKMLLAMVDDIRVILVKLADRLHNMRTLEHMPPASRRRIARETLEIYAPLAHRLGMGRFKEELEDLGFRFYDPERFRSLKEKLEKKRKVTDDFIEQVAAEIRDSLRQAEIPCEVTGRIKALYSIHKKLLAQQIDIEEVYDYIAFRVITDRDRDCYAVLGILHGTWQPVPGRIKDFIAMPKPNGYRALHTSVISRDGHPFEVQIRTREMHMVAEEGIAAHWQYKDGRPGSMEEIEQFSWLRQLIESQREMTDPGDFLQVVKLNMFPDDVYCFTPRGDVKALPKGATPIDFAYAVHTEVGHRCVGAKVNGKMVPLRTELRNGDIIEILTRIDQQPSKDWLKLARTSRAKSKIRHWLNVNQRKKSVEVGKAQLDKELKRQKMSLKRLEEEGILGRILGELNFRNLEEFHAAIGFGKTTPQALIQKVMPEEDSARERLTEKVIRTFRPSSRKVTVRGQDDILTTLARCCNPIRGEEILGYITRGRGVSVHRVDCPNVQNLLYDPGRKINVSWAEDPGGVFDVRVHVVTEDRPGLLAAISQVFAEVDTNIKNADAKTVGAKGDLHLVVEVKDVHHLQTILDLLKGVPGVIQVDKV